MVPPYRLGSIGTDPTLDRRLSPRPMAPHQLGERYFQLEEDALGRVYKTVDHMLGHVNNVRKRMFLCAAMEVGEKGCQDRNRSLYCL